MSTILFLVILGGCIIMLFALQAPQRRSQAQADSADQHLQQAGSHFLRNELDQAYAHFQSALHLARQAGAVLYEAEAFYGMAGVAEKKGDFAGALAHMKAAQALKPQLQSYKPNFTSLIDRRVEELEKLV
ncbi:MAG: hypothetical protein K2Y32_14980 [Candidatus Obscuribacterales bacterium]|nr:hypothetical protein [Candidatus Obscuribacterales bacterium]